MSNLTPEQARELLEVASDASPDEIKRAWRKLAREHHPDRNPDDPDKEAKFKLINEANQILENPIQEAQPQIETPHKPKRSFRNRAREKAQVVIEEAKKIQKRRDEENRIYSQLMREKRIREKEENQKLQKKLMEQAKKQNEEPWNALYRPISATESINNLSNQNITLEEKINFETQNLKNFLFNKDNFKQSVSNYFSNPQLVEIIDDNLSKEDNIELLTIINTSFGQNNFNEKNNRKISDLYQLIKDRYDNINQEDLIKIIKNVGTNLSIYKDNKINTQERFSTNKSHHYDITKTWLEMGYNYKVTLELITDTYNIIEGKLTNVDDLNILTQTIQDITDNKGIEHTNSIFFIVNFIKNEKYLRLNFRGKGNSLSQLITYISNNINEDVDLDNSIEMLDLLFSISCEYMNNNFQHQKTELVETINEYSNKISKVYKDKNEETNLTLSALSELRITALKRDNGNLFHAPIKLPCKVSAYALEKIASNYNKEQINELKETFSKFRKTDYMPSRTKEKELIPISQLNNKEKKVYHYLEKCYRRNNRRLNEEDIDEILEIQFNTTF